MQNAAARVIFKLRKFDHISASRQSLHWLPVKERIEFKTILLTYKALNGSAPQYLRDQLTRYEPAYRLRSVSGSSDREETMDDYKLYIPKFNFNCCGGRSFRAVAPKLWNQVPYNVRCLHKIEDFKCQLKTFLFKRAYDLN